MDGGTAGWRDAARQVLQAKAILDHAGRAVVEASDPVGRLAVDAVVLTISLQRARDGEETEARCRRCTMAARPPIDTCQNGCTHLAVLEHAVERLVILQGTAAIIVSHDDLLTLTGSGV